MNSSNVSVSTNQTVVKVSVDYFYNTLLQICHIIIYVALIIHLTYIGIICVSSQVRKRTYLYVNHASISSIFYILTLTGYIYGSAPNFPDAALNDSICRFSEMYWPFAIYIRSYSILLIAVYRYFAVFKINIYKKMNSSLAYLLLPLMVVWLIALGVPAIVKFALQTSYSSVFCLDGYSPNYYTNVLYYVITFSLNILIPSIIIIIIYVLILRKLRGLGRSLHKNRQKTNATTVTTIPNSTAPSRKPQTTTAGNSSSIVEGENSSAIGANQNAERRVLTQKDAKKEEKFANQFIIMCVSIILSGGVLTIFQLRNVIYNYFAIFNYWRPVLRSILALSLSLVPGVSIYYHPASSRYFQKIKGKFNANNQVSSTTAN